MKRKSRNKKETDVDHIHLLIGYDTTDRVCDIVKLIKQQTIFYLWQKYKYFLSKQYWKEKIFWSDGYFACSIGEVSSATIQKYIENQGLIGHELTMLLPPPKGSGFPQLKQRLVIYQEEKRRDVKKVASYHGKISLRTKKRGCVMQPFLFFQITCFYFLFRI